MEIILDWYGEIDMKMAFVSVICPCCWIGIPAMHTSSSTCMSGDNNAGYSKLR